MARASRSGEALAAKNCYVGQVVHWVMWYDPEEPYRKDGKHTVWYKYCAGRLPKIFSRKIERLTPKTITVDEFGKVDWFVYSCPQDAIDDTYKMFCLWGIGVSYSRPQPKISLGEASAFLRKLAELEFNLNNEVTVYETVKESDADDC